MDDEGLFSSVNGHPWVDKKWHTSVLENESLSAKSATPSSRVLVSAKATPTVFVLTEEPAPPAEDAILIAITMGADVISVLPNKNSSTACKFPGDACRSSLRSISS